MKCGGTRYESNGILLNADSKEDAAMFQYEFRFEDTELGYKYSRLSNQELREEELSVNQYYDYSEEIEIDLILEEYFHAA